MPEADPEKDRAFAHYTQVAKKAEAEARPTDFILPEADANALDAWIDARGGLERKPRSGSIKRNAARKQRAFSAEAVR